MGNREYVKKKWGMAVGKVSFSYYGTNELMVDLKKKKNTFQIQMSMDKILEEWLPILSLKLHQMTMSTGGYYEIMRKCLRTSKDPCI